MREKRSGDATPCKVILHGVVPPDHRSDFTQRGADLEGVAEDQGHLLTILLRDIHLVQGVGFENIHSWCRVQSLNVCRLGVGFRLEKNIHTWCRV